MDTSPVKPPAMSNRVLRALAGIIPGVGLGVVCCAVLEYGVGTSVFVGLVGAFIGAALAQPDVSTANVLKGTAGTIAAYNAPRFMQQQILDAALSDTPERTESKDAQGGSQAPSPHSAEAAEPGFSPDTGRM